MAEDDKTVRVGRIKKFYWKPVHSFGFIQKLGTVPYIF